MTATRATASIGFHAPKPSDGSHHEADGYHWLQVMTPDTRTSVGLHGDPADIATALVEWARLMLAGCDQEGRAAVYRAASGLKDAAVEGRPFPARLDVEARAIGDALLDEAMEAGR